MHSANVLSQPYGVVPVGNGGMHSVPHADEWLMPEHVERELRRYLECGILAHGFARAPCGLRELDREYLIYDPPKPGPGGSGPQCLTLLERLDRLAVLVPPPRITPACGWPLWEAADAEHDPAADPLLQSAPAFTFDQRLSW